jgi:hypothetical protein
MEMVMVQKDTGSRAPLWARGLDWFRQLYQYSALSLAVLCLVIGLASLAVLGSTPGGWACIGLSAFWALTYLVIRKVNISTWWQNWRARE